MADEVNTRFVASQTAVADGPYSLNVIEPPAAAPAVVGLMTGDPGLFAVPASAAESLTELPIVTVPDAVVGSVAVTGLTTKHSVAAESDWFGTPLVPDVNSARQQ